MSNIETQLRSAFEATEYDVSDVTVNRRQVRVAIRQPDAEADALRAIVDEAVGEENVLGLDVATESVDGQDALGTVVTFQQRP